MEIGISLLGKVGAKDKVWQRIYVVPLKPVHLEVPMHRNSQLLWSALFATFVSLTGVAHAQDDKAAIIVFARGGTDANLAVRIERDLRI